MTFINDIIGAITRSGSKTKSGIRPGSKIKTTTRFKDMKSAAEGAAAAARRAAAAAKKAEEIARNARAKARITIKGDDEFLDEAIYEIIGVKPSTFNKPATTSSKPDSKKPDPKEIERRKAEDVAKRAEAVAKKLKEAAKKAAAASKMAEAQTKHVDRVSKTRKPTPIIYKKPTPTTYKKSDSSKSGSKTKVKGYDEDILGINDESEKGFNFGVIDVDFVGAGGGLDAPGSQVMFDTNVNEVNADWGDNGDGTWSVGILQQILPPDPNYPNYGQPPHIATEAELEAARQVLVEIPKTEALALIGKVVDDTNKTINDSMPPPSSTASAAPAAPAASAPSAPPPAAEATPETAPAEAASAEAAPAEAAPEEQMPIISDVIPAPMMPFMPKQTVIKKEELEVPEKIEAPIIKSSFFMRKIGPVPVWGIGLGAVTVLGVGGFFLWKKLGS